MAERGPSGTGHDTGCTLRFPHNSHEWLVGARRFDCPGVPAELRVTEAAPARASDNLSQADPPVAVPCPASVPADPVVSPADTRIEALERALRIIETEVYGRPEPFCRRIAAEIVEVLGVAPQ